MIHDRSLRVAGLVRELGAFGTVGLVALAVDVGRSTCCAVRWGWGR